MIFHVIFVASLVTAALHLALTRQRGTGAARVVKVVLLHQLCVQWGFGAAFTSIPHIVTPDEIARYIEWEPGSPFQLELGFASLGTSILGILCIWFRGWFWLAPIVSRSVLSLGAAYVHILDIQATGNLSLGNAGPVLFYDIAIPVLTASLFAAHVRLNLSARALQTKPRS